MSDIYGNYEALITLIIKEYRDLEKLVPNHPNLKLIKNVDEEGFQMTDEFFKKYNTKEEGIKGKIALFSSYCSDLTNSIIKQLNGIIEVETKNFEEELWKKFEEKGLTKMVRSHITHNTRPLIEFMPAPYF